MERKVKRNVRKVLDKTTIDDRIASGARKVTDRTTVDDRLISASKRLQKEMRGNIAKAVLAAFGFLIALVWRDVIKEAVDRMIVMLSLTGDGLTFQVITAFVTTVICVVGIIYFSRWGEK
jgi:hypothetical protein